MTVEVKCISFEEILPFWQNFLWPGRESKIETHSAIVYNTLPYQYNADYFNFPATFFGLFYAGKLVGVNSGHLTGPGLYRSRGLYVDPVYRGMGFGKYLLESTKQQGSLEGATGCWSIPRFTSRMSYFAAGFTQVSDLFGTETSMQNFYVISEL